MPPPLASGVRVTCDVGYLYANFGLHWPLCSRLKPDVRDRQTSDKRQTRIRPIHHSAVASIEATEWFVALALAKVS